MIGAGARLRDCYVGPYTAIGEGCAISGAEVEHSILLAGSSVCDLDGRMESSLLGRNVTCAAATASRAPIASWLATTPTSRSCDEVLDLGIASREPLPARDSKVDGRQRR